MVSKHDILIIEDEQVVIDSAKKILIPEGFRVDFTFDVVHALEKLETQKYKLILTDLMLPKISGLKLVELVNKKYPNIPIIMITGYATFENAVQSLKMGAFDFIPKPFAFEELLGVVHRAMKFSEIRITLDAKEAVMKQSHQSHNMEDNSEKYYFLGRHSWARLDTDGSAKLGVGDTFLKIIGKIKRIDFPAINEMISQGNILVRIFTQEPLMHTVWAALSGKVIEHNREVETNSALINKDPFHKGWLVCVLPTNLQEELADLTPR